jgi:putative FmdB family regulatory protein
MPTYEYRCKNCDHEFEIVQAFTDASLTECPECGGVLKKVFGNVGITFKGSGFYKTDSRSAGSFGSTRDADRSDTGSSSGSTGSGSTSGDAKGSGAKGSDSKSSDSTSSGSKGGDATRGSSGSSTPAATPAT